MNAKLSLLLLVPLLSQLSLARPPGGGRGPGGGGGGGPLPAEQRETIINLFSSHKSLERKLTMTKKGYKATTTSKDPKVAAMLKKHVAYMEGRLEAGFPVRRWDPAYEEFFRHYKDLKTKITPIANGIEVTVRAKTPEAVVVAQNHAGIISGFIAKGEKEHLTPHPAVVDGKAAAVQGGGCGECKGGCICALGAKPAQPAKPAAGAPAPACKGGCNCAGVGAGPGRKGPGLGVGRGR